MKPERLGAVSVSLKVCAELGCSALIPKGQSRCQIHERSKAVRRRRRFRVWDKMMRGPRDPEPRE